MTFGKLSERYKTLMAEYGAIALGTYLVIFGGVLVGFAIAIQAGVAVESAAGTAGVWGAAYVATKVTQPVRILATLALTPIVGRVLTRFRAPPPPAQP